MSLISYKIFACTPQYRTLFVAAGLQHLEPRLKFVTQVGTEITCAQDCNSQKLDYALLIAGKSEWGPILVKDANK